MIADLEAYAEYMESGLLWFGLLAEQEEISADIPAIEKRTEGLLGELLGGSDE